METTPTPTTGAAEDSTGVRAVDWCDARWGGAELLAGGTDLLSLQKENIAQPLKVISLSELPAAFRNVLVGRGGVSIRGARGQERQRQDQDRE